MLIGIVLVIFAFNLALPISQLCRHRDALTLGIALASVLLAFLMMITRRKAIPQVIGFLAMENGLFFAATSATYGMPMVVELGIALDVLVGAFVFGIFFFQIRETFDSLDTRTSRRWRNDGGSLMPELCSSSSCRSWVPRPSAFSGRRRAHRRSMRRSARRTLLAAVVLAIRVSRGAAARDARAVLRRRLQRVPGRAHRLRRPSPPSLFSRPYMRIEVGARRVGPTRAAALPRDVPAVRRHDAARALTNNIGILWVAMEAATLTTVLLVSLYRTPASVRGGVEVLHPLRGRHRAGAVRHHPAVPRRRARAGGGGTALLWTHLERGQGPAGADRVTIAFVFLLVGYGTKAGLVPLHNWLPDAHAEGPTPISAVLSGLLLNVALYAVDAEQGAGGRRARHTPWRAT
jgi:hypothetical protein